MGNYTLRRGSIIKHNMLLKVRKDTIGSSHTITQKENKEKAIDKN